MFVASFAVIAMLSAPKPPAIAVDADTRAKLQLIAFQAVRDGDTKTLTEYFAAGFSVNEANPRGDTFLCVAAYNGQPEVVALILKQPGVKIEASNKMGLTALSAAAFKGDVAIAKLLVKHKADANAANESGQTPLMFAALTGRTEMVKYLLEAGADPAAMDKSKNTAASLARGQGAKELAESIEAARKQP